mgnify:FL=1
MDIKSKVRECFLNAKKYENRGKKHKGLLIVEKNDQKAEEYIQKAKTNLEMCDFYKEKKLDYKIPEEWFYTLYYCALAILIKFGVESRSQKCTALFLRYVKEKGLINYDDEFVDRITVYGNIEQISDVDERENARYGSSVRDESIIEKYEMMMNTCKRAISQCEEVIFSDREFKVPK